MDAMTQSKTEDARHSHIVRPANMEWQKTRFPGCEVKTLLFEPNTGLVTALMRCAAGATLPDHEHVKIEQTYMIEGRLVDKEGPAAGIEVNAGEFVWREPEAGMSPGHRRVRSCSQCSRSRTNSSSATAASPIWAARIGRASGVTR